MRAMRRKGTVAIVARCATWRCEDGDGICPVEEEVEGDGYEGCRMACEGSSESQNHISRSRWEKGK